MKVEIDSFSNKKIYPYVLLRRRESRDSATARVSQEQG